jgi:hypothetical protein
METVATKATEGAAQPGQKEIMTKNSLDSFREK